MGLTNDDLLRILQGGRESLGIELKPWQNLPGDPAKEIISKACMALHNSDGGVLVIGMQDDGTPDNRTQRPDVRTEYHPDVIQRIVSTYAAPAIETLVHYVEFGGAERVIIEVPAGVKTPVICKNDLPQQDAGTLRAGARLKRNAVYVRTLQSNGVVSSSIATHADWPRIMETCFNNRESDIGAFMRRQLSGIDISSTSNALFDILKSAMAPTPTEAVDAFMGDCFDKFQAHIKQNSIKKTGFREVAAIISGEFPTPDLTQMFLWRMGNTPDESGWPPFVAVTAMNERHAPVIRDENGAESFVYSTDFGILDFSRIDSSGKFYFVEALHDDMESRITPFQQLELVLQVKRLTDTFAKILSFAKTFCGNDSPSNLTIAIRWHSLKGRRLSTWAHPDRLYVSRSLAHQQDFLTHVTIPVSTAVSAIGPHISAVVKKLVRLFGSDDLESRVIEKIVEDRIARRG